MCLRRGRKIEETLIVLPKTLLTSLFLLQCLTFIDTYRVYYHEYDDSVPGQPVHLIKDVRSSFTSHAPPAVFIFFLFSNIFVTGLFILKQPCLTLPKKARKLS